MIDPGSEAAKSGPHQIILETPRLILRVAQPSDAIPLYEAFKDPEVMRYWSTPPHTSLEPTQKWITSMITSPQNGITDFIITLKQPPSSSLSSTADADDSTLTSDLNTDTTTPPLPIGKIGIYRPPPANEIGFLIARRYWGRGLAKEAQKCMLDYLFSLERVEYDTESQSQSHSEPQPTSTPSGPSTTAPTPDVYTTLSSSDQFSPWLYPRISADVDPRNEACKALLARMGFEQIGFVKRTDFIGGEWVDSVFFGLERGKWIKD